MKLPHQRITIATQSQTKIIRSEHSSPSTTESKKIEIVVKARESDRMSYAENIYNIFAGNLAICNAFILSR